MFGSLFGFPEHTVNGPEGSLAKDRWKRAAKAAKRRRVRAAIARGFRVPRGDKKLFVIQAVVEVQSTHELDEVIQGVNRVLCPVDPHADHQCARRWMVITHPAEAAEVREWEPLLNER